ncbi:hypothetical protein LINPERPRIM_LOCUS41117, partial [Linum perenne]
IKVAQSLDPKSKAAPPPRFYNILVCGARSKSTAMSSPTAGRFRISTGSWLSRRRGKNGEKRWRIPTGSWLSRRRGKSGEKRWLSRRARGSPDGGGRAVKRGGEGWRWRRRWSAVEAAEVGGGRLWRRRMSAVEATVVGCGGGRCRRWRRRWSAVEAADVGGGGGGGGGVSVWSFFSIWSL